MCLAVLAVRHSRLLRRAQVVRQPLLQIAIGRVAAVFQQQLNQPFGVVDRRYMQRCLAVLIPTPQIPLLPLPCAVQQRMLRQEGSDRSSVVGTYRRPEGITYALLDHHASHSPRA